MRKESYASTKDRLFNLYGNKCNRCNFNDKRALQLDHIVMYTQEDIDKYLRSGLSLYLAILNGKKDKNNFQLLCANCNWIKRHELNETAYNKRRKLGKKYNINQQVQLNQNGYINTHQVRRGLNDLEIDQKIINAMVSIVANYNLNNY